ncbi:MAG: FHIPEP family type III secretion protein [Chloroflexi bacterium]|nr:FHIPEP family type III secretion protein [Chloroflexota bacterium]
MKKKKQEIKGIGESDLVILSDWDFAIELHYEPGGTPSVVRKARKKSLNRFLNSAQERGIPLVELTSLDESHYKKCNEGEEIPPEFYRDVALAMALVYRTQEAPVLAKIIKVRQPGKIKKGKTASDVTRELEDLLKISPVAVELGVELYDSRLKKVEEGLAQVRSRLVLELGINFPKIDLRKNSLLPLFGFQVKIREIKVTEGSLDETLETADPLLSLFNQVRQAVTEFASDLLGYHEVEALVENIHKNNPTLIKELFPHHLNIPTLRFILRNLLREGISIRDLTAILEAILDNLSRSADPDLLTEYIRSAFGYYLCNKYTDPSGKLNVLLAGNGLERIITGSIRETSQLRWLELPPDHGLSILRAVSDEIKKAAAVGIAPVVLCSPTVRRFLRRILEGTFPYLAVLSYSEIPPLTEVSVVGTINL